MNYQIKKFALAACLIFASSASAATKKKTFGKNNIEVLEIMNPIARKASQWECFVYSVETFMTFAEQLCDPKAMERVCLTFIHKNNNVDYEEKKNS